MRDRKRRNFRRGKRRKEMGWGWIGKRITGQKEGLGTCPLHCAFDRYRVNNVWK